MYIEEVSHLIDLKF